MALRETLARATLTTAAVAVLTAGANDAFTLVKAIIHNSDTITRTVYMYLAEDGGVAATTNQIYSGAGAGLSLSAGETKTVSLSGIFLVNGAKFYVKAGQIDTTTTVNLFLSYNKSDQPA